MTHDFICHRPTQHKDIRFVHTLIGLDQNAKEFDPNWTMAHLMFTAGIFSSISQARKAGWNHRIPLGFSQHTVGKKREVISILNGWH